MYYFKYFFFAGSTKTVRLWLLIFINTFQKICFEMKS